MLVTSDLVALQMDQFDTTVDNTAHEQEPMDRICGISIKELRKKFKVEQQHKY